MKRIAYVVVVLCLLLTSSVWAEEAKAKVDGIAPVTPTSPVKAVAPVEEKAPEQGKVFTSIGNLLQFYGQLRLDYSLDTSECAGGGNWVFWVLRDRNKAVGDRDFSDNKGSESNIHARNTRLGFKIKGTHIDVLKADLSGKFEIDFFGGETGTANWKAIPRLRVGALTLDWGWVELMAGNNWDTFSTLYPSSDDNAINWWTGNLGARRTMLRLSFKPMIGDKTRLWVQAAIARPFDISGQDYDNLNQVGTETDLNADGIITAKDEYGRDTGEVKAAAKGNGVNDGEASKIPQIQWRVAIESPIWTKTNFLFGLSGHYQRGKYSKPIINKENSKTISTTDSYHIGAELVLPIIDELLLRGEAFYGQSLKDVMGGLGQDINTYTGEEIKGMGGWAELYGKPFGLWHLALGFAIDTPDDGTMDVGSAAALEALRFSHWSVYFSNMFNFGSGFGARLGYTYMRTEYRIAKDATYATTDYIKENANNHRVNVAMFYKF